MFTYAPYRVARVIASVLTYSEIDNRSMQQCEVNEHRLSNRETIAQWIWLWRYSRRQKPFQLEFSSRAKPILDEWRGNGDMLLVTSRRVLLDLLLSLAFWEAYNFESGFVYHVNHQLVETWNLRKIEDNVLHVHRNSKKANCIRSCILVDIL